MGLPFNKGELGANPAPTGAVNASYWEVALMSYPYSFCIKDALKCIMIGIMQ